MSELIRTRIEIVCTKSELIHIKFVKIAGKFVFTGL